MAGLGTTYPTLLDMALSTGKPDIIAVAEMLNESNDILPYLPWRACNNGKDHITTIRTGLPAVAWKILNYGTAVTKSKKAQVRDTTGMLEAWSETDEVLLNINKNDNNFLLSEAAAFIEAMNQEFLTTLFSGNAETDPQKFTGLNVRYSTRATAAIGRNIVAGGAADGQSDTSSIWLLTLGPQTLHGIVPEGVPSGLQYDDLGVETVRASTVGTASQLNMRVRTLHFQWHCGISLRNWMHCVRICNIDMGDITYNAGSGANLIDLMTQALEVLPTENMAGHSKVWVCNRTIKSFLRRQIVNKVASSTLTMDQVAGKHVMTFEGYPVLRCDKILNTETALLVAS